MARRKQPIPIDGLGDSTKLTVQKSRPLMALWQSQLTLSEFKILDTYLSRINSHEPDKRMVIFNKGELEQILGVTRINQPDLESRLQHLVGTVVTIPDPDPTVKKRDRIISLFEEAVPEQDEDGLWTVQLECTQKAMRYIFNIEHLGYLRYKLRSITALKSRYSYIMLMYLESNRFRGEWDISVSDLKEILNCDKEETYSQYKHFNNLILKKIHKELTDRTECRYSYAPIRRGRSVVALHFVVEPLAAHIDTQIPGQLSIDDITTQQGELWESVLKDAGFSAEQMHQLRTLIETVPPDKMPDMGNGLDIDRFHYVRQKWARLVAQKKPIRDRHAYLCRTIEQDVIGG